MTDSVPMDRARPEPGSLWPVMAEGGHGITLDPDAGHAPVPIVHALVTCARADVCPDEVLHRSPDGKVDLTTMPDPEVLHVWLSGTFAREIAAMLIRQADAADAEAAAFRARGN